MSAHAEQVALAPGVWTLTHTMNGGPGGGRERTETLCFAANDLVRDPALPVKPRPPEGGRGPQCSVGAVTMRDGRVSYPVACKTPMGTAKGSWTGTYSATQFDLTGGMKMGFMAIKGTLSGRHIGACPAR